MRVPSNTTSSLLSVWCMAPHTKTEGPRLPSMGWMHTPIGLSPWLQLAHEHDHHCETVWSETHHCACGPTFCALSPHTAASPVIQSQSGTPGGTPWSIASSQAYLQCSELTTSFEMGRSSPHPDEEPRGNDCPWPFDQLSVVLGCG